MAAFFKTFYNKSSSIILIFFRKFLNFPSNIHSLLKYISFITIILLIIGNHIRNEFIDVYPIKYLIHARGNNLLK